MFYNKQGFVVKHHSRSTHYQEFNVNTSKIQQVSLSISPENRDKTIDYVAFMIMCGYNESEMPV